MNKDLMVLCDLKSTSYKSHNKYINKINHKKNKSDNNNPVKKKTNKSNNANDTIKVVNKTKNPIIKERETVIKSENVNYKYRYSYFDKVLDQVRNKNLLKSKGIIYQIREQAI